MSVPPSLGPVVATGRTSTVYEFGADAVIKISGQDIPGHWALDEAAHNEAARRLGAPAPEVLSVEEVEGRPAVVFRRIIGPSMLDLLVANPSSASRLGLELSDVHSRILRSGLTPEIPTWANRMANRVNGAVDLAEAERAEALQATRSLPAGAALLHGDLHPGNVLMSPEGPVVIDWFDAALGHPIADITRTSILIRPTIPGQLRPHLPGADDHTLRVLHDAYLSDIDERFGGLLELGESLDAMWTPVVAAGRLSEQAESNDDFLVELWRARKNA